jgi:hypothetical protein
MTGPMLRLVPIVALLVSVGCAHQPLRGSALDEVSRPAFISRIEDEALFAKVFRDDSSYSKKLGKLDPAEADRRLKAKLSKGMTRFEVSESLRAATVFRIAEEYPWTETLDPAMVATALQSFLVEEVPAGPPDYDLLKPYGVDAVVEIVVQEYGMRSSNGRAGPFIKGYARMFRLADRSTIWFMRFHRDTVDAKAEHLDPLQVGQNPELFSDRMRPVLDEIGAVFAKELTPKDRRGGPPVKRGTPELDSPPDDTNRTGNENGPKPPPAEEELPPGELPPP